MNSNIQTIVNGFNDIFVSVGSKLLCKIPKNNDLTLNYFLGIGNSESLCLCYVNVQVIWDVVYEINNKTSTECNYVGMELVKNCID